MTLHAISHRWGMHCAFYLGGVLVGVAGQTKSDGSGGDQLHASDIAIDANLVATGAAQRDRGMDGLALGFIFVAGDAGGGIGLGVKWDRMLGGGGAAGEQKDDKQAGQGA